MYRLPSALDGWWAKDTGSKSVRRMTSKFSAPERSSDRTDSGPSLANRRCTGPRDSFGAPEVSFVGVASPPWLELRVRRRVSWGGFATETLLRFFASVGGTGGSRWWCRGCVGE